MYTDVLTSTRAGQEFAEFVRRVMFRLPVRNIVPTIRFEGLSIDNDVIYCAIVAYVCE